MFPGSQASSMSNQKKLLACSLGIAAIIAMQLRASAQSGAFEEPAAKTRHVETNRAERRHLDALAHAAKVRTDEALCAAVVSADQTQQALGAELQRQRDAIFAQSPFDSAALQRLEKRAAAAVERLPGIGLAVGAETVYHYVRYGALVPFASPGSASARALRLSADIWRDPAGLAVYYEPSTDVSGCQRPASVVPILHDLAVAWPAVASCLKSSLHPKLMASVAELVNGTCYCEGKPETASALKEIDLLAKIFAGSSSAHVWSGKFAPPQHAANKYLCR